MSRQQGSQHHFPPSSAPDPVASSQAGPSTSGASTASPPNTWSSDSRNFRIQGWDPVLIIAQILALQTLHYLTLALLIPPLLSVFADPTALEYEGGAANVAMIIDWREMAGRGTLVHTKGFRQTGGWAGYGQLSETLGRRPLRVGAGAAAGGKAVVGILGRLQEQLGSEWTGFIRNAMEVDVGADARRGWVLGAAWATASLLGVFYLYHLIRRPTHILDHALTLTVNHLILTTYYASAPPTSLWFYIVLSASVVVQVVWAENLCVRREMREGLGVNWKVDHRPDDSPAQNRPGEGRTRYERVATEERA